MNLYWPEKPVQVSSSRMTYTISAPLLLIVYAGIVLSPRLGDAGLANFIRIDDLIFPVTVLVVISNIGRLGRPLSLVLVFVLLHFFNMAIAAALH